MEHSLQILSEDIMGGITLRMIGRLTAKERLQFESFLAKAVAGRPGSIVLDLEQLKLMDSRGLGLVAATHKQCLEAGIGFRLQRLQPQVLRLFRMTNLDRILHVEESPGIPDMDRGSGVALWESYEFSRQLLRGLGDGVMGADGAGKILFASSRAEALFGWDEAALRGRTFESLLAEAADRDQWPARGFPTLSNGQQWISMTRRTGSPLDASINWVAVEREHQTQGYLIGIRNRNDLEEMRRTLNATERRLRLIVAASSDAMFFFNAAGRLTMVNPAAMALTGRDAAQMRELGIAGLGGDAAREQWKLAWDQVRSGELVQSRELALQNAHGIEVWCSVSGTPVTDEADAPAGSLFALRDIDESRRMRERLQELKTTRAVARVAAGMARDFEILIANEEGKLEELAGLLAESSRGKHLIAEMRQQHNYLKEFAGKLSALNRTSGERRQKVSLASMAEGVLTELSPRFGEHIRVSTKWPKQALDVDVAPDDLKQIVREVCLNSIESMGERGELRVWSDTADLAPGPGEAGRPQRPGGRYVRLCIEDTGPGMTPEVRRRAFEPYFTTKAKTNAEGDRAGLGLPLVYGLLRQYDGWVDLKSESGRTTRVELYLPNLELRSASGGGKAETAPARVRELLVVDDEELVLNFAATYLERSGYRVHRAQRPDDALELLQSHGPAIDLAVVDLSLPGMTGAQLMERMHAMAPELRFMISSGLGDRDLAEAGQQAGVAGVLQKPYRGDQLLAAVKYCLERASFKAAL